MQLITRTRFYLDVTEEVEYLARKAGPATALRWSQGVDSTIQMLLRNPKLGRPRTDLHPAGVRAWRVEHFRRWLIFYAVEEKALVLLRIRYGTLNLTALEF